MDKLIKFLISISCGNKTTYYFFSKEMSYILPIELQGKDQKCRPGYPSTVDTLRRTINALDSTVAKLRIYFNLDEIYYTYLTINKNGQEIDINAEFQDAVETAILFDAPMYVSEDILKDKGFKITKELIERSLCEDQLLRN